MTGSTNETPAETAAKAAGRTAAGRFAKGRSGNPKGRPPTALDVRTAAARYSIAAVELLGSILLDGQASRQQRQQAALMLLRISGRGDAPSEAEEQIGAAEALHARAMRLNERYNGLS